MADTREQAIENAVAKRERAYRATIIKLATFVVVMLVVMTGLFLVFSRYQPGATDRYSAIFSSASQMKNGSRVQIAGVNVGTVHHIGLTRDNKAKVDFSVDDTFRLPKTVHALIRYENLTGDRYLALEPGDGPIHDYLPPGAQIPESATEPALDLDHLLGGFKPLFRTLKANEVNDLSAALIAVFQGQSGALNTLLQHTASFTGQLADRDALIGSVIDNLNTTLGTLQNDHAGLDHSVDLLQQLVSGLSDDRSIIGESIGQTSSATTRLADLLGTTRPDIKQSLTSLGQTSDQALQSEDFLRTLLGNLPGDFKTLSNLGSYGAWLQIYFCRIRLILPGPGDSQYYFTAIDAMGDKTKAGGRCSP
ncbi:MAG: MCE family protein [Gordonia sp. (in: high G+C Gram-positive bacteria)]|uniref:MCE family protein n=1 Tax=Gordonia sp. (in: high G+C Gram-positive bacteria) TaxID=84139 RepID=UPI0039E23E43